jgi:hypothetical protein
VIGFTCKRPVNITMPLIENHAAQPASVTAEKYAAMSIAFCFAFDCRCDGVTA